MPRYVATQPIQHGWALAYNTGDPVHPTALKSQGGWVDDALVKEMADDEDGRPEAVGSDAAATYTDADDESGKAAPAPAPVPVTPVDPGTAPTAPTDTTTAAQPAAGKGK